MTLNSINLTFENCESVTIPIEYINSIHVGGISRSITYNKRNTINPVTHQQTISNAYILFNGAFSVSNVQTTFNEQAYDRIKQHTDITYIDLIYDTHCESYYVTWPFSDFNLNNNPNQSNTNHYDGLTVEIKTQ